MKRNRLLFSVLMLAVLLTAVVLLAPGIVDTEAIGERVAAQLEETLELEVYIAEPTELVLWRGPTVIVRDVSASADGETIAQLERATARLAIFPLLRGQIQLRTLDVDGVELQLERFEEGVFNVYRRSAEPGEFDSSSLARLDLSNIELSFLDQQSGMEWQFASCAADMRDISYEGGELAQVLSTLAANGEVTCAGISQGNLAIVGATASLRGRNGVFAVEPISATIFSGELSGGIDVDLSVDSPIFEARGVLSDIDPGAFMATLDQGRDAGGTLRLESSLESRGRSWEQVRGNMSGALNLTAEHLTVYGLDLDEELDGYAATQRFNLVDVGGLLLAGPLGLMATRSYSLAGSLADSGESTQVLELVSQWTVRDGVAQAKDVAFRTAENRLALAGALDFVHYRIDDVKVAVLDREGCAVVEQRISGPFRDPEVEQPNALVTLVGPLIDLVERGVAAISGDECAVFYTGAVPHP